MFRCELCDYSTKLKGDMKKHNETKYHIKCVEFDIQRKSHETEMDAMRKSHAQEIADLKKTPGYDSIEDVRTAFFLNSMFMNQTKKDYELQDFGRWIVMNRMVCKSFQLE